MANKYYPNLASPITLAGRTFKNRMFGAPMSNADLASDCTMTADNIAFYDVRASGGIASVCISECIVDMEIGLSHTKSLPFDDPMLIPSLTECGKAIHKHDCMAVFELSHGGKFAGARSQRTEAGHMIHYGPSDEQHEDGSQVIAMDEAMIERTIRKYAEAAKMGKYAGFDMAFIHGGHGWLLGQFMSPNYNHRTDEYGGSLENRMRLPLAVVDAVRKAVGPKFPIEFRISGAEYTPGGYDLDEGIRIAEMLDGKVDLIHVSAGIHEERDAFVITHPSMFLVHGCNVHLAAEIKKHVETPVATLGGINDPDMMEDIIASGKADVVEVSRQLLADPAFAKKALTGHADDITKCCRCYTCFQGYLGPRVMQCALNPVIGKEREHICGYAPSEPKRVAVIGGGPAGLEAALTAKKRGHDVVLLEKGDRLGGQLLAEEFVPFKADLYNYVVLQAKRVVDAGVDVRLSTEATPELLESLDVDVAIIATGAKPVIPPIPGIDLPIVAGLDALHSNPPALGQKVVILGGGLVGSETAVYLDGLGKDVTLIEMRDQFAADASDMQHIALEKEFRTNRVEIHLNTTASEITPDGLTCKDEYGNEQFFEADTILLAAGMATDMDTVNRLRDAAPWTICAGDAVKSGLVVAASAGGHYAAIDI